MRYELSDYEWTAIKPMLPNKPRGVRRVNDRRVLNGIFWALRSGAPWRDLRLDLKMDRVVLRLLLLELRLMRCDRGIGLRPRLHGQKFWVGRRRWRRGGRVQELPGLRIDRGRILEERVSVLVAHD